MCNTGDGRAPDHGGFHAAAVRAERGLDLGGADAVPAHVYYVVHPPGDRDQPGRVAPRAVAREVVALRAVSNTLSPLPQGLQPVASGSKAVGRSKCGSMLHSSTV